jgi:xylulokinase
MKATLGIDVGTQSTKALVYDADSKKVLARSQAAYDLIAKDDGTREQEASWWTDAIAKCLKDIDPSILKEVKAIGVSGQQHGFVPVDAAGKPLRAVKLWCDTSTAKECAEIEAAYGSREALLAEAGNLILPGYTISKILWLKKHEPALYSKMAKILLPHDYVNFWLTGAYTMEYGDASGTGLMDVRARKWNAKLLKILDPARDLSSCLPPLIEAHAEAGRLSAERAKDLGLPAGIPVSSGGGDNMMGAIGTGNARAGAVTMSMGTSGTLYAYSDKPIIDPDGAMAAFCSSTGGWLPLLCTMNCTVATEVVRELFGYEVKAFDAEAAKAPAGAQGLVLLPFFNGERTPNLPRGKASFMGMDASNATKPNMFRAAMESAVFGMRMGLDSLKALGFEPKEIRITGGGSASPLWRQIAADVLNLPVVYPDEKESACLGAALQALWCLDSGGGKKADIAAICDAHVRLDPSKAAKPGPDAKKYGEAYASYERYLKALKPLYV